MDRWILDQYLIFIYLNFLGHPSIRVEEIIKRDGIRKFVRDGCLQARGWIFKSLPHRSNKKGG
jgi:hypothetical protein